MIEIDLHSHTLFSLCGLHTVMEMLNGAKERGLKGLGVTDHGPLSGGRLNSSFFERLKDPVPGIKLIKGAELNLSEEGTGTDIPERFIEFADILLMGIHDPVPKNRDRDYYTDRLIRTMKANPYVDCITHPNSAEFPVHYEAVATTALELGMALEMNNSKVLYQRINDDETRELIRICKKTGCPVLVNSDSHAINEIGNVEAIGRLLHEEQFPEGLIINRQMDNTLAWIEKRRVNKKLFSARSFSG